MSSKTLVVLASPSEKRRLICGYFPQCNTLRPLQLSPRAVMRPGESENQNKTITQKLHEHGGNAVMAFGMHSSPGAFWREGKDVLMAL